MGDELISDGQDEKFHLLIVEGTYQMKYNRCLGLKNKMKTLFRQLSASLTRRHSRAIASTERSQPQDVGIGAEAPIKSHSQDRLRRADFADRIADVLSELNVREGRVFAIRGGWGFGKSSLKNLITEKLDGKGQGADWLDFNPWQWGDGDSIARALFGQLADRLGGEHSKAAKARAEALRHYGAILTGSSAPLKAASSSSFIALALTNASVLAIASAIGFDLPTAAKVAAGLAALSIGVPFLGRLMTHFGRDRSSEPLDKIRSILEARLQKLDRPLVVFVDDIDRLEPEQIRMLLRQVKANANLPNIIFVLLFQSSIVEAALNPVANGDGSAFLEKIVQTNFDLPAVPTTIVHKIFGEELNALAESLATKENGFTEKRWGNAFVGCIKPMIGNMRDARRLLSSISVHMPLHLDNGVFEVNIVDFLVLETLRVFEPHLYAALFRERALVLQEGRYEGYGRRDEDKTAAQQLLECASTTRRNIARDILKALFPPLEWAYGGTNYAGSFQQRWLSERRVCSTRFFPRYFELQTTEGEISERQFVMFLNSTATEDELAAALATIEMDGLLPSLVARLDESVDRLPVQNVEVLLPGLFRIAQKFSKNEGTDPFSSPWLSAWRATSWYLKTIPEHLRGTLVLKALNATEGLSIAAMLIHLSAPADHQEGREFDPALSADTIDAVKSAWLAIIRRRAANGGNLLDDPDLVSLIYRWRHYTNSLDEPKEFVERCILSDHGFASMATRLMGKGSVYSDGDRVATTHYSFNKQTISDLIGIEVAKARCDVIIREDFPDHKLALDTLQTSLEKWLGLRKSDIFD